MLKQLYLSPPLAVARLGSSHMPLECFYWGPNDDRPRGTGKTTIVPGETLCIKADGTVSSYMPSVIQFKDGEQFRPVCPFFELHGIWTQNGKTHEGPITQSVMKQFGFGSEHLLWTVRAANLKPFHMTRDQACRIEAYEAVRGNQVKPIELRGVSPSHSNNPLIPSDKYISLGTVSLTKPNEEFPEFRLRFIPAKGRFYGPAGLREVWKDVEIPDEQLFLNENASWVGFVPAANDPRTNPGRLYAGEGSSTSASFGVVDDVCDAIITCSLSGSGLDPATARVTVSPPDYAPDRRHLISIADALKDHTDRDEVWQPDYVAADSTAAEIQDLFERIFETMGLMNVEVFNNRVDIQENPGRAFSLGIPYKSTDHYAFPPVPIFNDQKFPLTERGRQLHRRMISIEVLQDMFREKTDLIDQWIRPPGGNDGFFTMQMPPVMRDSSGGPLHLTRRQYDLLRNWVKNLRRDVGAS